MGISLRCYHCSEWVTQPNSGIDICPCKKLSISLDAVVRGLYSEFWNEEKDLHFVYDSPRGM